MGRLIVLMALSLTGCVSQVNPIHLPDHVRFEPALIGTWRTVEGSSNPGLTFEVRRSSGDEQSYHVTVRSGPGPEVTTEFRATLAEIDGQHYLTIADLKETPNGPCSTVVVDGWACKIKVRLLKPGWLHQAVRVNPSLIAHRWTSATQLRLTATREELLAFYQKHLGDKEPWDTVVLAAK